MKKQDMIKDLAEKFEITQVEAKRIYDATFEELTSILGHGDSVNIPGFGTFSVTFHKKRKGYNPQIQKFMMLPQKLKTKFKTSVVLKNKINANQQNIEHAIIDAIDEAEELEEEITQEQYDTHINDISEADTVEMTPEPKENEHE